MLQYTIEIRGSDAENDAHQLQQALTPSAQITLAPVPESKGLDPITMLMVTAAALQSVDILYGFYAQWRLCQRPGQFSRPAMLVILPDGTRIELADKDPKALKRLLSK